jgi:hypothetical protein
MFCSISDRPSLSDPTRASLLKYCQRHQYGLVFVDTTLDASRHISWSKIVLLDVLIKEHPNYDYYVWADDDILITNHHICFESFIMRYGFHANKDATAMFCEDVESYPLNCGMMVVKPGVTKLLNKVWVLGAAMHYEYKDNWEQDILSFYWLNLDKKEYLIIPHKTMQSFYRDSNVPYTHIWTRGDFAAHVTGMKLDRRIELMQSIVPLILQ